MTRQELARLSGLSRSTILHVLKGGHCRHRDAGAHCQGSRRRRRGTVHRAAEYLEVPRRDRMVAAVLRELSDSVSAAVMANLKLRRRRQLGTPRRGSPPTALCRVGASGGCRRQSSTIPGGGRWRLRASRRLWASLPHSRPPRLSSNHPMNPVASASARAPPAAAACRAAAATGPRNLEASDGAAASSTRRRYVPGRGRRPLPRSRPSSTRSSSAGTTPAPSRTSGPIDCAGMAAPRPRDWAAHREQPSAPRSPPIS